MSEQQIGLSRRSFIGTTASALAAVSAGPLLAHMAPPSKKLGVALVGLGSLTINRLLPAFAKSKLTRPVALVSGSPEKARREADKYGIGPKGIYSYDTFDTIKDNPDVDIVYIVLPNGMHAEYTVRAAKAAKHVLCEKPMANTVDECHAMIDACTAAKRKLMIAYRLRYEPMTIRAIELARSADDVGVIKQITAEGGFPAGDPTQWRLNKKLAGGGPLMDIGIYAVNAIRYLSGQEPAEVSAFMTMNPSDPRFKEVEETMTFQMRFDSGLLASGLTTYAFGCNRFRAYGTRGRLEAEPMLNYGGNRLWLSKDRERVAVDYTPVDHFASEMDHFADCILNDKPVLTPGEEGLADMKVITAAYQSAQTGRPVKV